MRTVVLRTVSPFVSCSPSTTVRREPHLVSELRQALDGAFPIAAHGEVRSDDQAHHSQTLLKERDKLLGGELRQRAVEGNRDGEVDLGLVQQIEPVFERREVPRLEARTEHGGGVLAECHDAGHEALGLGLADKLRDEVGVSAVNAVENANGEGSVAPDGKGPQLVTDRHSTPAWDCLTANRRTVERC